MFYIGWRDLQFRRRRFIIAILATSLVFAIALILSGVSGGLQLRDHAQRRLVRRRRLGRAHQGGGTVQQLRGVRRPTKVASGVGGAGKITAMAMARVPPATRT